MTADLIPTRAAFPDCLRDAIGKTRELRREAPGSEMFAVIERQLEFMQAATSGGRVPPESERMTTDIGPIAARNLEESHPEYARLLQEIDYAFRRFEALPSSAT